MTKRSGFILIIVIGLLGVMAALAIQLSGISSSSEDLSQQQLWKSMARLHARSGIELALRHLESPERPPHHPYQTELIHEHLQFTGNESSHSRISVTIDDPVSRIFVNDGLTAGQLQLAGSYSSTALDPYGSGTLTADRSAEINMRLRRLLNAYGDVWKYTRDVNLGHWSRMSPGSTDPTQNFTFTSSACDDRHEIIGTETHGVSLPAGDGLGDLIIENRPGGGYAEIEELRILINQWGDDHLTSVVPDFTDDSGNTVSFFDLVKNDLTATGAEDDGFFEMTRDFGPFYDSDFSNFAVSGYRMDQTPMDLENGLWARHPVHRINLNAASAHVRAAIFYAPCNVEYVAEGVHRNHSDVNNVSRTDAADILVPTIGIGGPVFDSSRITENGSPTGVQVQRLMSLRDAWFLSMAYLGYSANTTTTPHLQSDRYTLAVNWPDSFRSFATLLKTVRTNGDPLEKHPYERCDPAETPINDYFAQDYVEKTLPSILSPYRRMPGWLNAPIAMLNPYHQSGSSYSAVLRSAEDFVRRVDIPKIRFTPSGVKEIRSFGSVVYQSASAEALLQVKLTHLTDLRIRNQTEFNSFLDPASSPHLRIGPEFTDAGVDPHEVIGFAGLKPIETSPSTGARARSIFMNFDGDLSEAGVATFNYPPVDPLTDTFTTTPGGAGNWIKPPGTQTSAFGKPWVRDLMTAQLEGTDQSVFAYDTTSGGGCDFSPFGGLSFSSRSHGVSLDSTTGQASPRFTDSLFWRPYYMVGSTGRGVPATAAPGAVFNKGMISVWYRVPSGVRVADHSQTLLHMMVWRRIPTDFSDFPSGPVGYTQVTRPISLHLLHSVTQALDTQSKFVISDGPISHSYLENEVFPINLVPEFGNDIPPSSIETSFIPANTFNAINTHFLIGTPDYVDLYGPGWPFNSLDEGGFQNYLPSTSRIKVKPFLDPSPKFGLDFNQKVDSFRNRYTASAPRQSMRPGSWIRLVAKWNYGNTSAQWNFDRGSLNTYPDFDIDNSKVIWNSETVWYPPIFNPQMIMTLGEVHNTTTRFISNAQRALLPDTHFPMYRLNSLIDDLDVRFGSEFTGDLEADVSTKTWRFPVTDGDPAKYDSTVREPELIVNPQIPAGTKITRVACRIYDVPAEEDPAWQHHTPWIDVDLVQAGMAEKAVYQSDVGTAAPPFTSPELSQYAGSNIVDDDTRIHLTWKALTPAGAQYLSPMLTNIPWIEEVVVTYSHEPVIESFIWD